MHQSAALSFYWHDYETWGEVPSVDRPCQFAGVRTDWNLNVLGEPLMVFAKPSPDFLPKPEACLVTGLSPLAVKQQGLPECDFIAKIHEQLSHPGTCGVGYNSIRFDDEVTRFTLYRNFFDPYEREWRNGNSRWDLIDVVRLTHALRPEGINWPHREDGAPSFRLEELTKANGLAHEAAHDALSDVYATIDLSRLIKQRQPRLFDYALALRNKRKVGDLVDPDNPKPVLHISSRFGPSNHYAAVVFPLMAHPINKNAISCFNLSCDPRLLLSLDVAEMKERLFTKREDYPEGWAPLGLKDIHLNKSPMVLPIAMLDADVNTRLGLDKALCEENWRWFMQLSKEEWLQIRTTLTGLYTREAQEAKDVDQQLYDGFFGDGDRVKMAQVRMAAPAELTAERFRFEDERLNQLLFRYKARNYPQLLSVEEVNYWEAERYAILCNRSGGASKWFEKVRSLLASTALNANQQRLLNELLFYAESIGVKAI